MGHLLVLLESEETMFMMISGQILSSWLVLSKPAHNTLVLLHSPASTYYSSPENFHLLLHFPMYLG